MKGLNLTLEAHTAAEPESPDEGERPQQENPQSTCLTDPRDCGGEL